MANINLNINVLDGTTCPTLVLIDETTLSIIINEGSPILGDSSISTPVPQDSTVTITVDKTGYNSYVNTIDVSAIDVNINIVLTQTVVVDFINITNSCHSYIITNKGTDSSSNVTYDITDLDNNIIGTNQDIELDFGTSKTFVTTSDGVYIVIVKDNSATIIRQYIILDYCNILNCISNRILNILCECDCEVDNCNQDFCKQNFELERIFLLGFDLLNRINKEYRLNSYYTTIDDIKLNDLKATQDIIDKLNLYCSTCGDVDPNNTINFSTILNNSNTSKSDCGCS